MVVGAAVVVHATVVAGTVVAVVSCEAAELAAAFRPCGGCVVVRVSSWCVVCTSAERTDVFGSVSSAPLLQSQNRAPPRRGTDAIGRSCAGIVGAEPPWGEQPQAKQPRPSSGLSPCGFDNVAGCSAVAAHDGPRQSNHARLLGVKTNASSSWALRIRRATSDADYVNTVRIQPQFAALTYTARGHAGSSSSAAESLMPPRSSPSRTL